MPTFKPLNASDNRCQAINRRRTRCGAQAMIGKRVCRHHGGKSTGAKTPEGKARSAAAGREALARYHAKRRAIAAEKDAGATAGSDGTDAPRRSDAA